MIPPSSERFPERRDYDVKLSFPAAVAVLVITACGPAHAAAGEGYHRFSEVERELQA
jgi:hypothetical protein